MLGYGAYQHRVTFERREAKPDGYGNEQTN